MGSVPIYDLQGGVREGANKFLNHLSHPRRKRLSHLAQALAIELLQLQFILKRNRVAKIDAVKQRLFRQGKIISLPWFKPEIEPVADMRVFDGDPAPGSENGVRPERL